MQNIFWFDYPASVRIGVAGIRRPGVVEVTLNGAASGLQVASALAAAWALSPAPALVDSCGVMFDLGRLAGVDACAWGAHVGPEILSYIFRAPVALVMRSGALPTGSKRL